MGRWMFSVCIMVVEAWGNVYFFDTFLGRKKGIFFCRYRFPAYLAMMFAASTAGYWIDMWKLPVYILGYILLGRVCYQAGWIQGIYFSIYNVIDYCSQTQAVYDHLWNCSYPINELLHSFLDLFTGVKKYVVYY